MTHNKYSKFIEYLLITVVFIVCIIASMYKIKHPFWDKQPVMRENNSILGKIKKYNPKFNIKLHRNQKLYINNYPYTKIYNFLNNNFSNNYNINEKYFNYIYSKPKSFNVVLEEENKIIGFILTYPVKITIYNRWIDFYYVDYLCIEPKLRNNYIATIMIASIINLVPCKPFLFQIDGNKLPFLSLLESKFYIKDLSYIKPNRIGNVKCITPFNFYKYYYYINRLLKRHKLYHMYTKKEFYELFLKDKILDLYIISNPSGSDTCVIGKKNIYTIHNKVYNSFEIDLLIGEMRYSTEVYKHLSNYLKSLGYNYIVISAISTNFTFIENNCFMPSSSLRFYTYNYNIPVLNQNDFSLSIN